MTRWSPQFKVISKILPELFEKGSMWERYSEIEMIFKKLGGCYNMYMTVVIVRMMLVLEINPETHEQPLYQGGHDLIMCIILSCMI